MSRTLIRRAGFLGRLFPRLVVHIVWSSDKNWHVEQHEPRDKFNMFLYVGSIDKGDGSGDSGLMVVIWKLRIVWGWVEKESVRAL